MSFRHKWTRQFAGKETDYPYCRSCGVVKRCDGKNKPCRGVVHLRPMENCLKEKK